MRKKRITLLSLLLSGAMVLSGALPAFALNPSYSSVFSIGEGTSYYQLEGSNDSGLQSVNYVEYQPNSGVTPMIAYGNHLYGKSTITYIANFLEQQGMEVIAGINADFFDTATGLPIGIVIDNGVFVSSNQGYPAIGFKADGSAIIGTPANAMYLEGENGNTLRVNSFNKTRTKYSVCLLDENFGTTTKTTTAGTNVILERVDNEELAVNDEITMRVVSITKNTTESPAIGSNQMVLTASNDCQTDISTPFAVGEQVSFRVNAENHDWDDVLYAVGGKVMLNNGVVDTTGNPTGTHPRSAVGIKADGTVVLYEVDGRQSGFSAGMTMSQLAQELLDLGCVDAINLDGGGSSAMIIQKTGEEEYGVVNSPSDGSLRQCANYIMLVNNRGKTGEIAHLGIYPEYKYMMKNSSITLSVKGADSGYYAVAAPADVNYSITKGTGNLSGNILTAGSNNGVITVRAESGNAVGSQNVYVVAGVNNMTVAKKGSASATTSLSVGTGEKVDLDVLSATYNAKSVKTSDRSVTWDSTIGTIDEEGVFTAGNTSGSGVITATYGNCVKTISVTVKQEGLVSNEQDILVSGFEKTTDFRNSGGSLALNAAYGNVHNGRQALAVGYTEGNSVTLSYTGSQGAVAGTARIYAWLKGNHDVKVTATFSDAQGNQLTAEMSNGLNDTEYINCSANIPDGAETFTGLILTPANGQSGTVYMDQIVMSSMASADTDYPVIRFTSYPQTVSVGQGASFIVNISDDKGITSVAKENIQAYVDGKAIGFTSNAQTGNIAFNTTGLSAGLHRVTVEASDVFGNLSRESVEVIAGTATTPFVDVGNNWSTPYIGFVAEQGIVQGEVKNGQSYFNPKRNLTRAEFAVIMARYLDLDGGGAVPYVDQSEIKSWAADAVSALYDAGIMTGTEVNGKLYFYPTNSISRQEVMTVISRSLQKGYQVTAHQFSDLSSIPAWSLPHINQLVSMGIVTGYEDGSIAPKKSITRAEIAKVISGLY